MRANLVIVLCIAAIWFLIRNQDGGILPPKPDDAIPAPIDGPGNAVLIVYESEETRAMPSSQGAIFTSVPFRDFLNRHNVEFRIWDQHLDTQHDIPRFAKALRNPRDSLPWIYISNGETGHSGPLPDTVDETQELISKHVR